MWRTANSCKCDCDFDTIQTAATLMYVFGLVLPTDNFRTRVPP
jgi:hypothetical protein